MIKFYCDKCKDGEQLTALSAKTVTIEHDHGKSYHLCKKHENELIEWLKKKENKEE